MSTYIPWNATRNDMVETHLKQDRNVPEETPNFHILLTCLDICSFIYLIYIIKHAFYSIYNEHIHICTCSNAVYGLI